MPSSNCQDRFSTFTVNLRLLSGGLLLLLSLSVRADVIRYYFVAHINTATGVLSDSLGKGVTGTFSYEPTWIPDPFLIDPSRKRYYSGLGSSLGMHLRFAGRRHRSEVDPLAQQIVLLERSVLGQPPRFQYFGSCGTNCADEYRFLFELYGGSGLELAPDLSLPRQNDLSLAAWDLGLVRYIIPAGEIDADVTILSASPIPEPPPFAPLSFVLVAVIVHRRATSRADRQRFRESLRFATCLLA